MEKIIREIFSEKFGSNPLIVRSPGRINLIGASSPEQLVNSMTCLENTSFTPDELKEIETILKN